MAWAFRVQGLSLGSGGAWRLRCVVVVLPLPLRAGCCGLWCDVSGTVRNLEIEN